jgi:hypothetical protein
MVCFKPAEDDVLGSLESEYLPCHGGLADNACPWIFSL